jgi:hypothetical protein
LQFFPIKVNDLPLVIEDWLPDAWEVVQWSLEKYLLNLSRSSREILFQIPQIIEIYSKIDKTCYLLEKSLLKIKTYLYSQEDFSLAIFQYLLELRGSESKIHFDDPSRIFDFFPKNEPNTTGTDLFPELDPDLCTDLTRRSTKSKDIFNILANFFPSQESFIKSFQGTLMNEYLFKGFPFPRKELVNVCKMIGPPANCLLVMMEDCSGDALKISSAYWPPLALRSELFSQSHLRGKNGICCDWKFDLIILSITFPNQSEPMQICCNQEQADFLLELQKSQVIKATFDDHKCIVFWSTQGVIDFVDDWVKLAPFYSPKLDAPLYKVTKPAHLDDTSHVITSELFDKSFDFESMMPFIVAMLTNLGPMNASRIHTTLSMFSSDYVNQDQNALLTFLEVKVTSNHLIFDDSLASFKISTNHL